MEGQLVDMRCGSRRWESAGGASTASVARRLGRSWTEDIDGPSQLDVGSAPALQDSSATVPAADDLLPRRDDSMSTFGSAVPPLVSPALANTVLRQPHR